MYDLTKLYCPAFFYRANHIINLILEAMTLKKINQKKYKLMMEMAEENNIRKQFQSSYYNEAKHYIFFQRIYEQLTGQFMDMPIPDLRVNNTLEEALENNINRELEEIELYRKIRNLMTNEHIISTLNKMIVEKEEHAAALTSLYNSSFMECTPILREQNTVTATTRELTTSKKYIDEDLRIPILQGIKNAQIQNQINSSIESDIVEFQRQLEDAAEEYGSESERQGRPFKKYVISTNYVITYNKNNIVSISIFYHEFIGGRHSYIRATYNYDIQTGRSLELEDLFKPGVPYKELIDREIRRQLTINKNLYPPGTAEKFKGIAEDQPFFLQDGNLVLFFGFNEIAPTIAEIPIIKIPFTTFRNELKPAFLR